MNQVYILMGGNLGPVKQTFCQALEAFELKGIMVQKVSSLYETEPWGRDDQPPFLNMCCDAVTMLEPHNLLKVLDEIELSAGRVRFETNGPRLLDLDILIYQDRIIETDDLTIPHPRMHLRNFTLAPLAEIAGSGIHPLLKRTFSELYNNTQDKLWIKKVGPLICQHISGAIQKNS